MTGCEEDGRRGGDGQCEQAEEARSFDILSFIRLREVRVRRSQCGRVRRARSKKLFAESLSPLASAISPA